MKNTPIPVDVAAKVFVTANDVIRRKSSRGYSDIAAERFGDGYLVIARSDERIYLNEDSEEDLDEYGNASDEGLEGDDYSHYVTLLALNKDLQTVRLTCHWVNHKYQGLEDLTEAFKNEVLCLMAETDQERTKRQAIENEAEEWAAEQHGFEGVCGDTSPEAYREWAYMNGFEPGSAQRLDEVMEQVAEFLEANDETQLLNVEKQKAGYWVIFAPNDEQLAFDVVDSDALDVVDVTLRQEGNQGDGSPVSSNVSLRLDDLTVRKAIELVVDKIGYGIVDDILAGPPEQVTVATYVLSVRSAGGGFKASAQLHQGETILQRKDFSGPDKAEVVLLARTAITKALQTGVALDAHDNVVPVPRET